MSSYLKTRKTSGAAAVLGEPARVLSELIRHGRIPRPARDDSGDYIWTEEDIERARIALAARRKRKPRELTTA
jgi:hypothetical protein